MRKVLIIAYYYPPVPAVASVRPEGLVRYLPRFGWEPIIVTPRYAGAQRGPEVVETDDHNLLSLWKQRVGLNPEHTVHEQLRLPLSPSPAFRLPHTVLISWLRTFLTYPDPHKGWVPFAMQAVSNIARHDRVDALISTAPPFACHMAAHRVQQQLQCPWIADFRDVDAVSLPTRMLMRHYLHSADAMVAVSDSLAGRLRDSVASERPVKCITNGFAPIDMPPREYTLTSDFTITYTGQLYRREQSRPHRMELVARLLQALSELINSGSLSRADVKVRFYGPPEPFLAGMITDFDMTDVVHILPQIPRQEALRRQRESQLLLLLGPQDPGAYTGKIFEYLAAARPVLAITDNRGEVADLIEETGAGTTVLTTNALRDVLLTSYREYRRCGRVSYNGRAAALKPYTHEAMAESFAKILDELHGVYRSQSQKAA